MSIAARIEANTVLDFFKKNTAKLPPGKFSRLNMCMMCACIHACEWASIGVLTHVKANSGHWQLSVAF